MLQGPTALGVDCKVSIDYKYNDVGISKLRALYLVIYHKRRILRQNIKNSYQCCSEDILPTHLIMIKYYFETITRNVLQIVKVDIVSSAEMLCCFCCVHSLCSANKYATTS